MSAEPCPSDSLLAAYSSGDATDEERASLETHVDTCELCRLTVVAVATADPDSERKRTTLGRYLIEGQLGAGAMGVVYAARDPELDRRVAIKLVRGAAAGSSGGEPSALRREARAIARLNHSNIVSVYDVGHDADELFIAMELVEGGNLREWLAEERSLAEVLDVFDAAGTGLAAAHEAGLIHRDFKPDNVLVAKNGSVKVSDFGLARLATRATARLDVELDDEIAALETLSETGVLIGTPAYMAPELFRGEAATAKTDQFAFCIALFESITGERPFRAKTIGELSGAVLAGKIRSSAQARLPASIRAVVIRGLSTDPDERFESLSDLLRALRPKKRRWPIVAVAGSLVAAIAVGGYVVAEQRGGRDCSGEQAKVDAIWNSSAKQKLQNALRAADANLADQLGVDLVERLERYTGRLRDEVGEACRATAEDSAQGSRSCLSRRGEQLGTLISVLVDSPTRHTLMRSVGAVSELPAPSACREATAEDGTPGFAEVRRQLGSAQVRFDLGDYVRASEILEASLEGRPEIEKTGIGARVFLLLARAQMRIEGGDEKADRWFTKAAEAAAFARDDVLEFDVAVAFGMHAGYWQGNVEKGRALLAGAKASRVRAGLPADSPELATALGHVVYRDKGLKAGQPYFERALTMLDERGEGDTILRAELERDLGLMKLDRARSERALTILERHLGPSHPDLVGSLINIATFYRLMDQIEHSQGMFERALAIRIAAHGSEHHRLALLYAQLAFNDVIARQTREGIKGLQRAAALAKLPVQRRNARTLEALAHCSLKDFERARTLAAALEKPIEPAVQYACDVIEHPTREHSLDVLPKTTVAAHIVVALRLAGRKRAAADFARRSLLRVRAELPREQQRYWRRIASELGVEVDDEN